MPAHAEAASLGPSSERLLEAGVMAPSHSMDAALLHERAGELDQPGSYHAAEVEPAASLSGAAGEPGSGSGELSPSELAAMVAQQSSGAIDLSAMVSAARQPMATVAALESGSRGASQR
jgi:hypothetical protein